MFCACATAKRMSEREEVSGSQETTVRFSSAFNEFLCLPAIFNFNKQRCLPIWLFYLLFSIFFINFLVSLSLFLSFPALTLIKKQTPVNEERWKRPKQCGIKSENQKWNVWLLEQTTLLLLLSWVICESKNQECMYVCVCWKKRVKTSKNSIKDKAKP